MYCSQSTLTLTQQIYSVISYLFLIICTIIYPNETSRYERNTENTTADYKFIVTWVFLSHIIRDKITGKQHIGKFWDYKIRIILNLFTFNSTALYYMPFGLSVWHIIHSISMIFYHTQHDTYHKEY